MFQTVVLNHGVRGWSIRPLDKDEQRFSYRYLAEQALIASNYERVPDSHGNVWKKREDEPMDIRTLMIDVVEKGVFPIIDEFCRTWKTPLELDDRAWSQIKKKISEWLHEPARQFDGADCIYQKGTADSYTMASLGLFDVSWKQLLSSFVEKVVFPMVDEYVRENHQPLEWDDRVWEVLKPKILEYLDKIEIQPSISYSYTVG